jgi:hypothetical protein
VNDSVFVFATGRDPDSGTRLNQSAEVGLGPVAAVKHYQPSTRTVRWSTPPAVRSRETSPGRRAP